MKKTAMLTASALALVWPAIAAAQPAAQPAQPAPAATEEANECQRLVLIIEGNLAQNAPIQLDQANTWLANNDIENCRTTLTGWREAQAVVLPVGGAAAGGDVITVQQQAPAIQVQQAAPEVTVTQPQPQVTVTQPQPQIIVRQPMPIISVQLPQPEIIVRMPPPTVDVQQAAPQVTVNQAQPEIQVVQPEQPQVTVGEQGAAQVQLQQGAEANVNVQQQGAPQVTFEAVGEPEIQFIRPEGQPTITIEEMTAEQAAQAGQQQPATTQQPVTTQQQPAAQQQPATTQPATAEGGDERMITVVEVLELQVATEEGEVVGEVDRIMMLEDRAIVIVTEGDRQLALFLDQLSMNGDNQLVIPDLTPEQVAELPDWDPATGGTEATGEQTLTVRVLQ